MDLLTPLPDKLKWKYTIAVPILMPGIIIYYPFPQLCWYNTFVLHYISIIAKVPLHQRSCWFWCSLSLVLLLFCCLTLKLATIRPEIPSADAHSLCLASPSLGRYYTLVLLAQVWAVTTQWSISYFLLQMIPAEVRYPLASSVAEVGCSNQLWT